MSNKIELPNSWICAGGELKPKSGASSSNTWVLSGKEIKPKSGATLSNTWVWDQSTELKPLACKPAKDEAWNEWDLWDVFARECVVSSSARA